MYEVLATALELSVIILAVVFIAILAGAIVVGVLFLVGLIIQCIIDGIDSLLDKFFR